MFVGACVGQQLDKFKRTTELWVPGGLGEGLVHNMSNIERQGGAVGGCGGLGGNTMLCPAMPSMQMPSNDFVMVEWKLYGWP